MTSETEAKQPEQTHLKDVSMGKSDLEDRVKVAQQEKILGIAKTAGGAAIPVAVCGAVCAATSYLIDNQYLSNIASMTVGVALGGFLGPAYAEWVQELYTDIGYQVNRANMFKKELDKLNKKQF